MGIIVIVVAAKYNPNFTPSNIKKIWTWQSQTDEISTIFGCSDEGPTQPGHPVLSKGASKATAADDQIRWAPWISQSSQIYSPLAILLAPFSDPGVLQRIQSFQTISASGPREIHADFLGASDFVPRRMPLSSKSAHSENASYFQWKKWQRRIWKIWRLKLTFRYQFRINVNPGLVNHEAV